MSTVLQSVLERLRELPFIDEAEIRPARPARDRGKASSDSKGSTALALRAGRRWHEYRLENVRSPLDAEHVEQFRRDAQEAPLLLAARHVAPAIAASLQDAGIPFADAAGNCYLPLDENHVAWISGRKPIRVAGLPRAGRGSGKSGYLAELALLADPELLTRPVREIAEVAGTGKSVVADLIARLRDQALVIDDGRLQLVDRQRMVADWLAGYERVLRPKLLVGQFEAADAGNPVELEARLRREMDGAWAFGGGTAAREWTRHWRGDRTVLHVSGTPDDLPRRLGFIPARRGRIHILEAPGRVAMDMDSHLAHPLLVVGELEADGSERAREAAREVRAAFPEVFE